MPRWWTLRAARSVSVPCAPLTGAQSCSASNTYSVSASGVPGCAPEPSAFVAMPERLSRSSTKYGPSVFSGVMVHVAEAACATSVSLPPPREAMPASRNAVPAVPMACRRVRWCRSAMRSRVGPRPWSRLGSCWGMARMLFTFAGGEGHLRPLLPVAEAAAAAGHDVLVSGAGNLAGRTELPYEPSGPDVEAVHAPLVPFDHERELAALRRSFAGWFADERERDLEPLCAHWRPDVLVRDETDFGAAVVAHR